jgi:fructosamine-3-kinase
VVRSQAPLAITGTGWTAADPAVVPGTVTGVDPVMAGEPWRTRVAEQLGATGSPHPLGDRVWRLTVGRRQLVVKVGAGVVDEAEGLEAMARVAGGPSVPEVALSEPDLLVMAWVEQEPRGPAHEEALGHDLAALHSAPWSTWGGGSSWIGGCPIEPEVALDGATFYGTRLLELAGRVGLERPVVALVDRIGLLLPDGETPALVHGDLWWGNVLWGIGGRPWLIDPSTHGGYPEEDLAMLSLFGPVPDRTLGAYREVRKLPDGWQGRVGLFRLYPLLVHTVLFGGGYREQVEDVLAGLA